MDTRYTNLACMLSEKEWFGRNLAYMFAKYLRKGHHSESTPAKPMMVNDVWVSSDQKPW